MKIYTRSGDEGKTSIIGGRVDKDDIRVEAYGTIDELNGFVGQAAGFMNRERFADLQDKLIWIQHELFDCGSDLAYAGKKERPYKVTSDLIDRLEQWIDLFEEENPPITRFILPGGTTVSSTLHVCRSVCRRAERRVVTLAKISEINPEVRHYLNRLSDFFFVVARTANTREDVKDIEYERSAEVFRTKP